MADDDLYDRGRRRRSGEGRSDRPAGDRPSGDRPYDDRGAWPDDYRQRPLGSPAGPGREAGRGSPGYDYRQMHRSDDDRDVGRAGRGYGSSERDHDPRREDRGQDRGPLERAGDEIASWFGSDEAERRREYDASHGDRWAQHHRGKGPRNYRRSDERIEEDVNDRLTDHAVLDASDIEVTVTDGEVTLGGFVGSRFDRRLAEDIAEDVSGVKYVQNNLRLRERRGDTPEGGTGETGRGGFGFAGASATEPAPGSTRGTTLTGRSG